MPQMHGLPCSTLWLKALGCLEVMLLPMSAVLPCDGGDFVSIIHNVFLLCIVLLPTNFINVQGNKHEPARYMLQEDPSD